MAIKTDFSGRLAKKPYFGSILPMSQDRLTKMVSVGGKAGVGKGHVIYTFKHKKRVERKLELKKYNPIARERTVYKESKK